MYLGVNGVHRTRTRARALRQSPGMRRLSQIWPCRPLYKPSCRYPPNTAERVCETGREYFVVSRLTVRATCDTFVIDCFLFCPCHPYLYVVVEEGKA